MGVFMVLAMVLAGVALSRAARMKYPRSAPPAPPTAASSLKGTLEAHGLFLSTSSQTDARVQRIFPNGVATKDAQAEVGTAPPPPRGDLPDGTNAFVSEIVLRAPIDAARARAALPPRDRRRSERWVKGVSGSGQWRHFADVAAEDVTFSRIAVIVELLDEGKPVDVPRIEREAECARALALRLDAPPPSLSMTPREATAKAKAAVEARAVYADEDVDFGVVITAPNGGRFAGKMVRDAAYSAGFTWGDGDYFH
jgi:hypothetical protein